ncbi:MAG: helix-turn-helix transcriptional regulator [Acidobacteria bacterium]|nr:helix-turn-helix transcriptional regulator [Acidobacteriota bacterium]
MAKQAIADLVRTHKALAHPGRLRILAMLRGGPLCVCQMTAVLKLAPSTVSAHLSELRSAGLVNERKEGKWVEYRLAEEDGPAANVAWERLDRDPAVASDRALLRELRKVPLEELCRVELDLSKLGIRLPVLAAGGRSTSLR